MKNQKFVYKNIKTSNDKIDINYLSKNKKNKKKLLFILESSEPIYKTSGKSKSE